MIGGRGRIRGCGTDVTHRGPRGRCVPVAGGAAIVRRLRQDTLDADFYSMVGFQNHLKFGEQTRIFRMIPGLEQAEFPRLGQVHRNSYINAPAVLLPTFQSRARRDLFFAGQISGVEGSLESAASGMVQLSPEQRKVADEQQLVPVDPVPQRLSATYVRQPWR